MKNIITFIATLMFGVISAQTTISLETATPNDYKNNNYIKDITGVLNPFVGTWQWTSATDTLTIKFVKKTEWNPQNFSDYKADLILGSYKYIKNGIVLYDNLNFTTNDMFLLNENFAKIIGSYESGNKLRIFMTDKVKHRDLMGYFTINLVTYPNPATAQLEVRAHGKKVLAPGEQPALPGESFPYNITLIKIN